jgi:hypothetical protein
LTKASNILTLNFIHCNLLQQASKQASKQVQYFKSTRLHQLIYFFSVCLLNGTANSVKAVTHHSTPGTGCFAPILNCLKHGIVCNIPATLCLQPATVHPIHATHCLTLATDSTIRQINRHFFAKNSGMAGSYTPIIFSFSIFFINPNYPFTLYKKLVRGKAQIKLLWQS